MSVYRTIGPLVLSGLVTLSKLQWETNFDNK